MSARRGDEPEIKVVLLGASGVGAKTSLLRRFLTGGFEERGEPTVGVSFAVVKGRLDGVEVKLNVWGLRQHTRQGGRNTATRLWAACGDGARAHAHRHGGAGAVPGADADVLPERAGDCGGL